MEQQLYDLLVQQIQFQLRHRNYDRTVEVRNFAHSMVTGENQTDILSRFRRHEDDKLKKQRERLTVPITKYVLNRPRKYFRKVARVDGINFAFEGADKDKVKELDEGFASFQDGKSLAEWLDIKLEFLGSNDPNAWIIYERMDERDTEGNISKTKIYPFVVPSVDALNFKRKFGKTLWLVVRVTDMEVYMVRNAKVESWLETYYLYAPGFLIMAKEAGKDSVPAENETVEKIKVGGKIRTFYFSVWKTGTTEVPGLPVGAYLDEKTGQESFVTWFDPAEHVLIDLIRDKSYLDVTKTLHVYAKRWEYVRPCKYTHPEHGKCDRGFLSGDQTKPCPVCQGAGVSPAFTTEQQVSQLALPKDENDVLELSKLAHTESFPIDLPEWLSKQVDEGVNRLLNAVLNSGVIEGATGLADKTATKTNYEYEDLYDLLLPYAQLNSRHIELAYRVGAQYLEIKDFKVDHRYPKDFKMKMLFILLDELMQMKSAGVGYDIQRMKMREIIEKQNEDNPGAIAAILARLDWLPFADKSAEEVAQILAARSPLDETRILRENWLEIFQEIEQEQETPAFHELEYTKQKEIVFSKVEQFKSRILLAGDEPTSTPQLPSLETPAE